MNLFAYIEDAKLEPTVISHYLTNQLELFVEAGQEAVLASTSVSSKGLKGRFTLVRPMGSEKCLLHWQDEDDLNSSSRMFDSELGSSCDALIYFSRVAFVCSLEYSSDHSLFKRKAVRNRLRNLYDRAARIPLPKKHSTLIEPTPTWPRDKSINGYLRHRRADPWVSSALFALFKNLKRQLEKPAALKLVRVTSGLMKYSVAILRPKQSHLCLYYPYRPLPEIAGPRIFWKDEQLMAHASMEEAALGLKLNTFTDRVMAAYRAVEDIPSSHVVDI